VLSAEAKLMVSGKKPRSKSIQPSQLLTAANQVIVSQGVDALTLDAVASEAGVSKGGLLHYFPTKEALIAGMVQQALDRFVETLHRELANDPAPDTPGHWVRAYIRASALDDQENYELHFNLLAANFTNPELLAPMRHFWQECHGQIMASGLDPAVATVIRLAMDGLWLTHLHGFAPLEDPLRSQVIATALKLAQP
jgi:AcrR family transcriptional regulator